jgi:hypothetical protein
MDHPWVGKNTRSVPISIQVIYEWHPRVKNLVCTHTWIDIPNNIIVNKQIK